MLIKYKYFYNQIVLVSAVTHKIVLNMSSVSKIAVCQLTVTNNKANNLSTVQRLVAEAKKKDVEVGVRLTLHMLLAHCFGNPGSVFTRSL